jgi:hypothetical protein
MKVAGIVFCAVSIFALCASPHEPAADKKVKNLIHLDDVFLDVDHVSSDKAWIRINNNSEFDIWVKGLPSRSRCEDFTEYYLEKLLQLKFSDEDRKQFDADPSFAGKTDEEIARFKRFVPRTIKISQERHMHWSDAIAADCGDLGAKQKASFEVPLGATRGYERLYIVYSYSGPDRSLAQRAPEHRTYFNLASLNTSPAAN